MFPIQFNVKRNVFIKRICFLWVISHCILGAHSHELLSLVEHSALFSESVKTVILRNFAGMNSPVIAVFHISKVYNIGMQQRVIPIVYADTEWIFLHLYTQQFSLQDCFFFTIC